MQKSPGVTAFRTEIVQETLSQVKANLARIEQSRGMYGIRAIYFKKINKRRKNNYLDISQGDSSMMAMARVVRLRVQSRFNPIITSTH